ncbi:MAG: anti-sigma factor family protein [Candidatus Hydrogenedentota bacterium]
MAHEPQDIRDELAAYLDGELDDNARRAIETYLAQHPEAQDAFEQWRKLDALYETLPQVPAPADFEERLARRLTADMENATSEETAPPPKLEEGAHADAFVQPEEDAPRPAVSFRRHPRLRSQRTWPMLAAAALLVLFGALLIPYFLALSKPHGAQLAMEESAAEPPPPPSEPLQLDQSAESGPAESAAPPQEKRRAMPTDTDAKHKAQGTRDTEAARIPSALEDNAPPPSASAPAPESAPAPAPAPPAPAPAPAPAVPTPESEPESEHESARPQTARRHEPGSGFHAQAGASSDPETQHIGPYTFEKTQDEWVQQGYTGESATLLKRDGLAFKKLQAAHAHLEALAGLDTAVVFRVDDVWYRLPEPG